MNESEKAWLAAAIDGEGTLGIYKKKKSYYQTIILICNSSLKFVEKAREITNKGSISIHSRPKGYLPSYEWHVSKQGDCLEILTAILPYLIIKREKAERILLYLKFRKQKGLYTRHGIVERRFVEGTQSEIKEILQIL